MYKVVGGIFFWLISVSAFAQVKITVANQTTGEKLEGASVVVKSSGSEQTQLTNESGALELTENLLPVNVTISYIGFTSQQQEITKGGAYMFSLVPSAAQLNQVVVTGQFEPQSVRQSVYQVRTISNERIAMRSPVNLQSALSTEIGIRFSNDLTLGISDIQLMGMDGRNVKILVDGIPLLDRGDTRESLNQIDVNTVDHIEIVEGPMSVVYGADAMAGVINIITKKYNNSSLTLEAKVQEETAAREYDAFGEKGVHIQSVNANWNYKKFYVGGGVTRNTHGGWKEGRPYFPSDEPAPYFEWHPKDQLLTNTTVGYRTNTFNIAYKLNYVKETISPLGNANEPTSTQFEDNDYITNRFNHQIMSDWEISDRWSFNGSASYQDLTRRTLSKIYDSETGQTTLNLNNSQDKASIDNAMIRGFFLYKLSDAISLQPGFEANLSNATGGRIDRDRSINDYAAFVSAEFKPTPNINIRPGLRFIYNSVYDAPPVIPSLNTKFTLGKAFDLRLAYAYGFRAPALRELYFYFYDASHSLEGNPDLKAESSNSFTGSLTWNAPQQGAVTFKSTVGSFYNRVKNLIGLYPYQNSPVYKYDNMAINKTTGVTLENNLYWKNFSASLGASYLGIYNAYKEDDSSLPEFNWSPEITSVIGYSFKKIGNTVSVYYKYTGKRKGYTLGEEPGEFLLTEREDFHTLDASVSQTFLRYLTLTVGSKNLLNVTQLQSTLQDGGGGHAVSGSVVPMSYGRSYFATLAVRWSK